MDTEESLNAEIIKITGQIEEKYPELYSNLGEMPVTVPCTKTPAINVRVLNEYYESLVAMFKTYAASHKK